MYHLVYLTRNLINNKIYVGVHSTWNLNDGYLGSGSILSKAISKYNKENFVRIILHYCYDEQQMYEYEQYIVVKYFIERKDTYNIRIGGKTGYVKIHSEETKKKISLAKKGKPMSQEAKNKLSKSRMGYPAWNKGIPISTDVKNKLYNSHKGKKLSQETKDKISKSQQGKPAWNKGISMSKLNVC